ncbi:MAG: hypothetical protein QM770_22785 [Tepidisphaeraceae bacterium]
MKSDLPRLMAERNLDAIVVHGVDGLGSHSASWKYLSNGQDLHGQIIVKRGQRPMILFHPMEIQQAEATGLEMVSMGRWDLKAIAQRSPTRLASAVELWRTIFADLGIRGRVGWYGAEDASVTLALVDALRRRTAGRAAGG